MTMVVMAVMVIMANSGDGIVGESNDDYDDIGDGEAVGNDDDDGRA